MFIRPSKSLPPKRTSFWKLLGVFDQITFSSFFDWNIFLSFGYIRTFDFSDQKLIAPSLKDKFLSGIIISSSNASISPRPSHVLHAPYGLLKLNIEKPLEPENKEDEIITVV